MVEEMALVVVGMVAGAAVDVPGFVETKAEVVIGFVDLVSDELGVAHVHGRLLPWQRPLLLQYDPASRNWQNTSPHRLSAWPVVVVVVVVAVGVLGFVERKAEVVAGFVELVNDELAAAHVHGRLLPWQTPLPLQYDAASRNWQNTSPHCPIWLTAPDMACASTNPAKAQRASRLETIRTYSRAAPGQ